MKNTKKNEDDIENEKIEKLPYKYRPLGAWGYLGYSLLYSIPIVGFILLIIFSFSNASVPRRNHARSFFFVLLTYSIIIGIAIGSLISNIEKLIG